MASDATTPALALELLLLLARSLIAVDLEDGTVGTIWSLL
jgi:hypothetical protein